MRNEKAAQSSGRGGEALNKSFKEKSKDVLTVEEE